MRTFDGPRWYGTSALAVVFAAAAGAVLPLDTAAGPLGRGLAAAALALAGLAAWHAYSRRDLSGADELRAGEERYRSFIALSSEAIWRFEADPPIPTDLPEDEQLDRIYRTAHLAECNDAMARMYGYERAADVLGKRVEEFMVRGDPLNDDHVRAFIRTGYRLTDAESRETDRAGRPKVFLNNLVGVVEGGRLVRAWGTQRDVTGRVAAEEALRDANRRLAGVLDSITEGYFVLDDQFRFVEVNAAAHRLVFADRPVADLIGRGFWDVYPQGKGTEFYTQYRRAVFEQVPVHFEARSRIVDKWFEAHAYPRGGRLEVYIRDVTDRKRAEEALARTRLQFQRMAEASPDVLYVHDVVADRVLYSNRALPEVLGYTPGDVAAMGPSVSGTLVHPADLAVLHARNRRCDALPDGEVVEVEYRVRRKDGAWRWYRDRAVVFERDPGGTARSVLGVCQDVTDQKHAVDALRAARDRLAEAQRIARLAHWEMDWTTKAVRWSDEMYRLLGLTPGAVVPSVETLMALVPAEDHAAVRAAAEAAVRGHTPYQVDHRVVRPDGAVRVMSAQAEVVFAPDGRPLRFVGTMQDVTERRRAEEDLRRSEERAKFLAEFGAALAGSLDYEATLKAVAKLTVPALADFCMVHLVGPDGTARQVAEAHADPDLEGRLGAVLRRYQPTENPKSLIGRALRTGRPEFASELAPIITRETVPDEELVRLYEDLGPHSSLSVPLVARGRALGCLTLAYSTSGRRYGPDDLAFAEELARRAALAVDNARLFSDVREADQRKDEFLAMLGHELRNPLAAVRTAAHVLRELGGDPDHQRLVAMVERQALQLSRLVDDLLDVARVTRGAIHLRPVPLELATVVAVAVEAARPLMAERRHEFAVELPDRPLTARADPPRVEQVVANLLANAAKYTPPGGRVALTLTADGGEAVIRVEDTGIGLRPEALAGLFTLFRQSDHVPGQVREGLGIGLALVKALVELHGGRISARSDGPGRGSTFEVRLPVLTAGEAPAPLPTASARPPQSPAPRRVLVVEDNRDAADSLALLLRLNRHDVSVVADGPGALAVAPAFRPDVVICDIGLPGMDGYEVARRLRALPGLNGLRLAALTGYGQDSDRRRAADAGFDHHFTKPVDPDELAQFLGGPVA
jgi:PAS domain S-box-containing protein